MNMFHDLCRVEPWTLSAICIILILALYAPSFRLTSEFFFFLLLFFFQAEDGIRDFCLSRGLGDVYKRQDYQGI